MDFDRKQTNYLWKKFLEWDKATDVQFNYRYVERKRALEIWIYFVTLEGERLRTDLELSVEPNQFSTPFLYNWTDEDLDRMVNIITTVTESSMEDWQK